MERSGSTYLLQDVEPVRLIGVVGSWTEDGSGSVVVSFSHEPGVFTVTQSESEGELVVKWDVALKLMALLHIVVLQNKILRGETHEMRGAPTQARVFTVTGGGRCSPITCRWEAMTLAVECKPVTDGPNDQFELVLTEAAATELVTDLAERIAANGTATPKAGRT
jgi:hypothetical protein